MGRKHVPAPPPSPRPFRSKYQSVQWFSLLGFAQILSPLVYESPCITSVAHPFYFHIIHHLASHCKPQRFLDFLKINTIPVSIKNKPFWLQFGVTGSLRKRQWWRIQVWRLDYFLKFPIYSQHGQNKLFSRTILSPAKFLKLFPPNPIAFLPFPDCHSSHSPSTELGVTIKTSWDLILQYTQLSGIGWP